jgi:hypothetical protein
LHESKSGRVEVSIAIQTTFAKCIPHLVYLQRVKGALELIRAFFKRLQMWVKTPLIDGINLK